MRKTLLLFFMASIVFSCNEEPFNSDNFMDERWVQSIDSTYAQPSNFSDTSFLSVRISSKKVMQGFLRPTNFDSTGAFGKLINMFSRFYATPHNPIVKKEYLFVDGDNNGDVTNAVYHDSSLFNMNYYSAKTNNLHFQFLAIAKEVKEQPNKRKFYVILSDGETTIRKFQNDNAAELTEIKGSIKDILNKQPDICIGSISLLSKFTGDYTYDPGQSKPIDCMRYLYAFCFFDKSFMPEFQRFADDATSAGGHAFIFNPQVSYAAVSTTTALYPDRIKATNRAKSGTYAAYSFRENIPDSIVVESKINDFKYMQLPPLSYKVYYYPPKSRYTLDAPMQLGAEEYQAKTNGATFTASLKLKPESAPGIYGIELIPLYRTGDLNQIAGYDVQQVSINDNNLAEVTNIAPGQILKTEGLKDLYDKFVEALRDIQRPILYRTYISVSKN